MRPSISRSTSSFRPVSTAPTRASSWCRMYTCTHVCVCMNVHTHAQTYMYVQIYPAQNTIHTHIHNTDTDTDTDTDTKRQTQIDLTQNGLFPSAYVMMRAPSAPVKPLGP